MSLLCWLPGEGPFQTGLRRCLQTGRDGWSVEYLSSLRSLLLRLSGRACGPETVILLEADSKTLDRLLERGELFSDIPLVLLLTEEDQSALAKGHLLQPRFMTGMAGDPGPVKQVLCNLMKRRQLENQMVDLPKAAGAGDNG